jgi:DNA recombination protein RmuC
MPSELLPWVLALGIPAGFLTGALGGAFICRMKGGQELQQQRDQRTRFETENAMLTTQLHSLQETEALLRMELNELGLSNTRLETLLEERQQQAEQQLATQQAQFEALSHKTLSTLKTELEEKAARDYAQRQLMLDERMGTILKPLKEIIEQNEKKVNEVAKQHVEDTASLKTHIELIVSETSRLVGVKNKLAEALSNSKGRGDWGEMELIRLLEHSGLIEGVHYEAQRMENGLRPDITIRLSNKRVLYVDAKTILVNLEKLLLADGDDEETALNERRKHAAALEKEILSLNLKAYESQSGESIDFVVLYVPRESMLRVALEERPMLMEMAFQRRVILASPLILMSLLKTVSYGWEQAQLSQKAQEIHALGRELHKRGATFLERFVTVGERIDALASKFEEAKTGLLGRQGFLPQLRKFEEYGCKSEKRLPDNPALLWDNELSESAINTLVAEPIVDSTLLDTLPAFPTERMSSTPNKTRGVRNGLK